MLEGLDSIGKGAKSCKNCSRIFVFRCNMSFCDLWTSEVWFWILNVGIFAEWFYGFLGVFFCAPKIPSIFRCSTASGLLLVDIDVEIKKHQVIRLDALKKLKPKR